MADKGQLGELVDGASARLDREPPANRPPTDHRDDFWIDQLGRVGFRDRTQDPGDPGGALRAEQEIDSRRGVGTITAPLPNRSRASASAGDSGTSTTGRLARRSSISAMVGRRAISTISARTSDSERRCSEARIVRRRWTSSGTSRTWIVLATTTAYTQSGCVILRSPIEPLHAA